METTTPGGPSVPDNPGAELRLALADTRPSRRCIALTYCARNTNIQFKGIRRRSVPAKLTISIAANHSVAGGANKRQRAHQTQERDWATPSTPWPLQIGHQPHLGRNTYSKLSWEDVMKSLTTSTFQTGECISWPIIAHVPEPLPRPTGFSHQIALFASRAAQRY